MTFKITFYILVSVAIIWILTIGALLFALRAFSDDLNKASTVAKGSVYMTVFALSIVLQIAIIFPGLLLLQPLRLWRVMRNERHAITPRQHFRGTLLLMTPSHLSVIDLHYASYISTTL